MAHAAVAQIPYEAGKTYQVRFDVTAKRCSVTVDGAELAKNYPG